jgi:site-specific recombinase XerD
MKNARKSTPKIEAWNCEGLRINVRGTAFHAAGTVRVGNQSRRVRETLHVIAAKENRSEAERAARAVIGRIRAELGGGVARKSVATLVAERCKRHIGPSDQRILKEFTAKFTTRILWDVSAEEIIAFVEDRQRGNKAETRERYISAICAFFNPAIKAGQYEKLPAFSRDQKARNPLKRARRPVQQFRTQLLEEIIAAAHITLATQIHVEYACGARVSSLLQGCDLGDLDMASLTLTFRDTKNGDDVVCALPSSMRASLEVYLDWRQLQVRRGKIGPGSSEPLFLHHKGIPYKPNEGAWGTQNKAGFNNAKRRAIENVGKRYDEAIAAMRLAGDQREVERLMRLKADDRALLRRITQHWLRHKFATEAGRKDMRAAMAQGGWRDPRSIHGYQIADAEFQRAIVEERGSPATAKRGA